MATTKKRKAKTAPRPRRSQDQRDRVTFVRYARNHPKKARAWVNDETNFYPSVRGPGDPPHPCRWLELPAT